MRLGLGTAQFGLPYGISNAGGQPDRNEIARIIKRSAAAGVSLLDTAPLYGDSELRLGECVPPLSHFRIVTKTPHFANAVITAADAEQIDQSLRSSLNRLRQPRVYGLLVHQANDLLKPGGELLHRAMRALQQQGLVEKIGISAYSPEQIEQVTDRFGIDLLQAPISVLDQRLVESGRLARLKEDGVEIHARSVFLQGLLLMEPETTPPYFEPIRGVLRAWRAAADQHGLTPLEAALGFVSGLKEVDAVICGITSLSQLEELLRASQATVVPGWFTGLSLREKAYLHPSEWRV